MPERTDTLARLEALSQCLELQKWHHNVRITCGEERR